LPLSREERTYFDHIARANLHLKQLDAPLLMLFAASVVRAMKKRRESDETFEKEVRAALALARSLRLTPQSTTEAKTAARRRAEADSISYYDRMNLDEEEH
jgi:predicted nucleic acid-binding protein